MIWLKQGQSGHCCRDQQMWRLWGRHRGIYFHPATVLLLRAGTRCIHRQEFFFLLLFLLFLSKRIELSGEWGEWKKYVCVCVRASARGQDCTGSEPHLVWTGARLLNSVKLCQIILTAGQVLFSFTPTLHDSWEIKEKSVIKEAVCNCISLLLKAAYGTSPWS